MAIQYTLQKINYIKTTSNLILFNVSAKVKDESKSLTFFSNTERYDDKIDGSLSPNKFCIKHEGKVIHNVYNSEYMLFHHLAARRHLYPYEKEYDYQHIYKAITDLSGNRQPLSIMNTVQSYNTLYSLQDLTTIGHYYTNDKIYTYLCRDNALSIPKSHTIDTLLYNKDAIDNNELSNAVLSVLQGVEYNIVYEIPGNIQQCYRDGSLYATSFKTKNQYNAAYSMSYMQDMSNLSILANARAYSEICNCNNQVYLKYKDTLAYEADGNVMTSYVSNAGFQKVKRGQNVLATKGCGNIPQIEVLKNINRGINCGKHKSTLYSINVTTTKIFTAECWNKIAHADLIQANIKREIKNYIRQLTSRIAPANTQLFAVTIK